MAKPEPTIAIIGGSGAFAAEALSWVLARGGSRVAGAFAGAEQLDELPRARRLSLRAAIVDADDPQAGLAAVVQIRRRCPQLKLLLLCEGLSPDIVRCAIDEHVEGLVLKSDGPAEVVLAVREVLAGRAVMPAGWHEAWLAPEPDAPLRALSPREREVLELAASGMTNKEIARELVISPNTVKFHLRTIYSRLEVRNRVQATQLLGESAAEAREPAGAASEPSAQTES